MGKPSKKASKQRQKHLQLDPRGDGLYSGTFRWLESKSFPKLPPFPTTTSSPFDQVDVTKGWQEFLQARSAHQMDLIAVASKDPSCLDALSFPITFVRLAHLLALFDGKPKFVASDISSASCDAQQLGNQQQAFCHVLIIGASCKAEQRIWKITNYWLEIAHFFAGFTIKLWFIGPEVTSMAKCTPLQHLCVMPLNLQVDSYVGTIGDFLKSPQASGCDADNSILVGFNTGFGNFVESGNHRLLFSWLSDLYAIADTNMPAIFACANDYADLNGEFAVQSRVIGANFLLLPQENPFCAASHLHEEGQRDTSYSRANSFVYAIRGFDASRRIRLKSGDVVSLQRRLDAPVDLGVLQDAVGRCLVNGTVLSRDQAVKLAKHIDNSSNSKATTSVASTKSVPSEDQHKQDAMTLETPHMELVSSGSSSQQVLALVSLPKLGAPESIQLQVHNNLLQLYVPGLYSLRHELPFQIDKSQPMQAQVVQAGSTPVLQILLHRS